MHYHFIFFLIRNKLYFKQCPFKGKNPNIDYLINQGKLLWDQRLDSLALDKLNISSISHKQRENDFELSVLYSQISFTRAYFLKE